MVDKDSKGKDRLAILLVIMLIAGIFFFFFIGENKGIVLLKDSEAYIDVKYTDAWAYGTMPGYNYIIDIFRRVLGEDRYLYGVMVLQGMVAIMTSIVFAIFLRREFGLSFLDTIIIYVLSFFPYCYSLPEEVTTHEILTESFSFSLFYIFVLFLLKSLYYYRIRDVISSVLLSGLLVALRKQAFVMFAAAMVINLYILIRKKKNHKVALLVVVSTVFVCITLAVYIYLAVYPKKSIITYDQITYSFAGKVIYMSDDTDERLYTDKDEKEIFRILYDFADKEQMLNQYAERSGLMRWQHMIKGVNYTTRSVWKNVINYCRDNEIDQSMTMVYMKDIVITQISNHPVLFIYTMLIPMGQSLISSIFVKPDRLYYICAAISAFLYMISILICYKGNKRNKDDLRAVKAYILTMVLLLVNVVILNVFFQSLQRYVVYTWGLFYISVYIILKKYKAKRSCD